MKIKLHWKLALSFCLVVVLGLFMGYFYLTLPLTANFLRGGITKIILGALVLVFLLGLVFALTLSLAVSRPLVEMIRIAGAMAKGDFSRKPYPDSNDELGDMAKALVHLSDEIKDKIEKITQETVKLDAIISSMFEGLMVVDEKGQIILMNSSLRQLFFIDAAIENKASIEAIRNPQIQDIIGGIIQKKQRLVSQEIDIPQMDDEKILRINAAPIIRNGVLKGAVLVFHDMTEIRQWERNQRDFVANVSHELRTPVTSIKGYAETLLGGGLDDKERVKEFINIIYQNASRLQNLINDLLELSVLQSAKMKMFFCEVDIKPIVDRSLRILQQSIKDKQLTVSMNVPDDLPKIIADDKRITQVFLNLLDNAVKYTQNGGSITMDISHDNKFVRVDVSDTGIGIPEKDLPRIFERLYRVDKSRSRELGGTGLGLSIAKHIVLAHHGEIGVKSKPDQGSTFSFTIPRVV